MGSMDDSGLDRETRVYELRGVGVVGVNPAHPSRSEKHVLRTLFLEERVHTGLIGQVKFRARPDDQVRVSIRAEASHEGRSDKTPMASDKDSTGTIHPHAFPRCSVISGALPDTTGNGSARWRFLNAFPESAIRKHIGSAIVVSRLDAPGLPL